MPFEHLIVELVDGVSRITLDRPDVLNSFNARMASELREALDAAAADDAVRAELLTGAGRGFCAGQDLAEVSPRPDGSLPDLGEIVARQYNPVIRAIRGIEKPVVAAVNGVAAGAGANLAFACDIVIAAEEASFIQSFSRIGLIPDSGGTFILPRLVGMARATALAMLGDRLTAPKALDRGLIWQVVPFATLAETARAVAAQLATQQTRALQRLGERVAHEHAMAVARRDLRDAAPHRAGADDADGRLAREPRARGAGAHRPSNRGFLFSRNARTPSA
jgi:2-(1,2-epoxy-1,2-dihydrophenyl)acetyl-CoA isomerase